MISNNCHVHLCRTMCNLICMSWTMRMWKKLFCDFFKFLLMCRLFLRDVKCLAASIIKFLDHFISLQRNVLSDYTIKDHLIHLLKSIARPKTCLVRLNWSGSNVFDTILQSHDNFFICYKTQLIHANTDSKFCEMTLKRQ
jgi:hypothetical protein